MMPLLLLRLWLHQLLPLLLLWLIMPLLLWRREAILWRLQSPYLMLTMGEVASGIQRTMTSAEMPTQLRFAEHLPLLLLLLPLRLQLLPLLLLLIGLSCAGADVGLGGADAN